MEVVSHPSPGDHFKAVRYVTRRMFRHSRWGYVVSVLAGVYALFVFVAIGLLAQSLKDATEPLRTVNMYALGSIALAFITGVGGKFIYDMCARRVIYRPGGYGLSPQRFLIEEEHFSLRTRQSETRQHWRDIEGAEKTPEMLFIFLDRGIAFYVPRRAFPDEASYDRFHDELVARIPKREA